MCHNMIHHSPFCGTGYLDFKNLFVVILLQVLNEVRRLEESAMRNDQELRQMTLEQQQNQRHLVIFLKKIVLGEKCSLKNKQNRF